MNAKVLSIRALITGITGFAGSHLAEHLLSKGMDVYGTIRWRSPTGNIDHIKDRITLIETDVKDAHSTRKLINDSDPDYLFHLAAQSFVPTSINAPQETIAINVIGTINILEAVLMSSCNPRIQIAGSSEEYGLVYPDELPITETNKLRPLSPYGVSKVAQDNLGFQYFHSYGMRIVVTRAFNHTGARRGEVFVTSNFAKQIAGIEKGNIPIIKTGNLEPERDFSDVRDIAKAYLLSLQKGKDGEVYNICSEKSVKIKDMLNILLSYATVKNIKIMKDLKRLRPSDVLIQRGDCTKFSKLTGWKPEITFNQTMKDLLNYWRG